MGQEPERAQSVVDGDDHGALGRQLRRVVVAGAVRGQTAAVDPHEHRTAARVTIGTRGRVHVEVEAVLAHLAGRCEEAILLGAARRESGRRADAPPPVRGLRRSPPEAPGRGSRIGQPAKRGAAVDRFAAHQPVIGSDDRLAPRGFGRTGGPVVEHGGTAGETEDSAEEG